MNKPILFSAIFIAVTFFSCQKKQSTQVVYLPDTTAGQNPVDSIDDSYYIPGLTDITITPFKETQVDIRVEKNTITDKRVSLSVQGFPPNSSGWLSVEKGYPSFNSVLNIKTEQTPEGVYPIKVTAIAEDGKPKDYTFDLKVQGMSSGDCANLFTERFNPKATKITSNSAAPILPGGLDMKKAMLPDYRIYLYDVLLYHDASGLQTYWSSGNFYDQSMQPSYFHIRLEFDCSTYKINIPEQFVFGRQNGSGFVDTFSVSGTGHVDFNTNSYSIKYNSSYNEGSQQRSIEYTLEGPFIK